VERSSVIKKKLGVKNMAKRSITIENIPKSDLKPKFTSEENLEFGKLITDRMFIVKYKDNKWQDPTIKKYAPLTLYPSATCFHYGQTIFEGQKAFRTQDGHINLFRPEKNAIRMNLSAKRMMMPDIDPEMYLSGLIELVRLEKDWIPKTIGSTLYIRPTMIATEPLLGLRASKEYFFFIILSPAPPFFPKGVCLKILVSEQHTRAAPGGMGSAKTGGNYGGSLLVGYNAKQNGFDQVLWLDAVHRKFVEEVGTMNIFFVIEDVLYTTPTENDTIVHGITRESVIQLAIDAGYQVKEEALSIDAITEEIQGGRLTECFGTGTAVSVVPVGSLFYQNKTHEINKCKMGPITDQMYNTLIDIQYGRIDDPYGWIVRVD
jgi:branched-chain amino acid aminotransferase